MFSKDQLNTLTKRHEAMLGSIFAAIEDMQHHSTSGTIEVHVDHNGTVKGVRVERWLYRK